MSEKPVYPFRSTHEFKGFSMWPTLRPGDGLVVQPYRARSVRVGDVIVFHDPVCDKKIVHRVIRIDPEIYTQGDNNSLPDQGKIRSEAIIGKVVTVYRRDAIMSLRNGLMGAWIGRVFRIRRTVVVYVSRIGRPLYRILRTTGILSFLIRWLRSGLQVICFQQPTGKRIVLCLWKRWPIAIYRPDRQTWKIPMIARMFMDDCVLDELIQRLENQIGCQLIGANHFQN